MLIEQTLQTPKSSPPWGKNTIRTLFIRINDDWPIVAAPFSLHIPPFNLESECYNDWTRPVDPVMFNFAILSLKLEVDIYIPHGA